MNARSLRNFYDHFLSGTRLHDGAVVLRDNLIIAASVYFPRRPNRYPANTAAAIGPLWGFRKSATP
jgi:DNA integrity scanning protein DisA with diadenylate cyclase activity